MASVVDRLPRATALDSAFCHITCHFDFYEVHHEVLLRHDALSAERGYSTLTIRSEARVQDIEGLEAYRWNSQWDEINNRLKKEESDCNANGDSKIDLTPTYRTILKAAQSNRVDFEHVLLGIDM